MQLKTGERKNELLRLQDVFAPQVAGVPRTGDEAALHRLDAWRLRPIWP